MTPLPSRRQFSHSSHDAADHAAHFQIPQYLPAKPAAIPVRSRRSIVLCFDGTGDQFDADNSNVIRIFEALKKSDPTQLIYYQAGIGTYGGRSQLKGGISAVLDQAVGSGLGEHVRQGYSFLMQNYMAGDKISLFGFSRGAYTARSLAGMLHKVGLLPRDNDQQVAFAYAMYKREDDEGWALSGDFKRTFCIDVSIHFLGVFDTVASIGWIPRSTLPFSSSSNPSVRHFRQALALDEHRAKFKQNHWIEHLNDISTSAQAMESKVDPDVQGDSKRLKEVLGMPVVIGTDKRRASSSGGLGGSVSRTGSLDEKRDTSSISEAAKEENKFNKGNGGREWVTDVVECWFSGAHCDIGGGAVPNATRHQLARIPLRWMLRACFQCDTDILFSTSVIACLGIPPKNLHPLLLPRQIPRTAGIAPSIIDAAAAGELPQAGGVNPFLNEEAEDYMDAMAPINDMLKKKRGWWVLEVLVPIILTTQDRAGIWITKKGPNWGRHRVVRDERPNLHYSVLLRQAERGYAIRNEVDVDAHWHVVM